MLSKMHPRAFCQISAFSFKASPSVGLRARSPLFQRLNYINALFVFSIMVT